MRAKLYAFLEDDKVEEVSRLFVAGYDVGERVLDGVVFTVEADDEHKDGFKVKVRDEDSDYFEGLNTKKWLNEVRSFVKDRGVIFADTDFEREGFITSDAIRPDFDYEVVSQWSGPR